MKKMFLLVTFFSLGLTACSNEQFDNSTVSELDLNRYVGKWYEIARYDHIFERGLVGCTANYTLQDNGYIKVVNAGYDGCEPDWDEVDRKYNQGLALAIQTFAQIMEIEDEDEAIQLLHYGLNEINKQEESKKEEPKEEEQEEVEIREITEEMLLEMMGADIPEICRECKHECPNAEAEECQYGEEHKCCRFPNEEDYIENVGLPKDDDEEHEEEHKCCGKCDNCTCCEGKEVEAKKLYTTLGEHNEQIKEEE